MMEKIGIYGGTFSPPHLGHVHAAKVFLQQIKPDKLLIIPTCMPPHKIRNEATSAEDRLEMCRLAFSFSDAIEISDIEIRAAKVMPLTFPDRKSMANPTMWIAVPKKIE